MSPDQLSPAGAPDHDLPSSQPTPRRPDEPRPARRAADGVDQNNRSRMARPAALCRLNWPPLGSWPPPSGALLSSTTPPPTPPAQWAPPSPADLVGRRGRPAYPPPGPPASPAVGWQPPPGSIWMSTPSVWNGPRPSMTPGGSYAAAPPRNRLVGRIMAAIAIVVGIAMVAVVATALLTNAPPRRAPAIPRVPISQDGGPIPTYSTQVTDAMKVGVVLISGVLDGGRASGTGVISADGLVLTNYRVVSDTAVTQRPDRVHRGCLRRNPAGPQRLGGRGAAAGWRRVGLRPGDPGYRQPQGRRSRWSRWSSANGGGVWSPATARSPCWTRQSCCRPPSATPAAIGWTA